MQRRFRHTTKDGAAEVWVETGLLRCKVELYENGEFVECKRLRRPRNEEADVLLTGNDFAALIRIQPGGDVRCTWSR